MPVHRHVAQRQDQAPVQVHAPDPTPDRSLADLAKGDQALITALVRSPGQELLRDRLEELGFGPGETLRVVATSVPFGDPIAVRIGNTTFALRRHEAQMIVVEVTGGHVC